MALLLTALFSVPLAACNGGSGPATGKGGQTNSGGTVTGGTTSSSGGSAAGGTTSTGGAPSSGGVTGSSGKTGSGGSSQTGGAGGVTSCSNTDNVTPCGGDVVGTWDVTAGCLKVTGALDPSGFLACATAPITNGFLRVTGTLTVKSDKTYSDDTTTSGTEQFTLGKECLVYSSTPIDCSTAASVVKNLGFADLKCSAAADGGCSCLGTVQQKGSMGFPDVNASTTGTYKASGNTVTLVGDSSVNDAPFSYCVSTAKMTWTPTPANPTLTGTIVLQKQGTGGAGGAGGSGGVAGSGGMTGAGGTAAGGRTGSGGTTGSGGASTGGRTGSGGTTATGGTTAAGGGTGSGGSTGAAGSAGSAPCDIFAAASTPCVAAHSTVRAMFAGYTKPLYQVTKVSDGSTKDISLAAGTNIADASAQDAFCGTTSKACTISIIYDQTGNGNDLKAAHTCSNCNSCPPSGSATVGKPATEAFADLDPITIAGHKAYGVHMVPCGGGQAVQTGYRCDTPKKTATGASSESVYFVVDGTFTNTSCCWDYGNASTNDTAGGMDAIEFSSTTMFGSGGNGTGPWVGADPEGGIVNGGGSSASNPNSMSLPYPFVTALLKNNESRGKVGDEGPWVMKGGDARSGALTTMWNGALSNHSTTGKGGGIILGIGGDGAAGGRGNFFEGAMTASFLSKATDDALQANIVAAGYGK